MGQDGEAPSDYQSFAVTAASSLIFVVNFQASKLSSPISAAPRTLSGLVPQCLCENRNSRQDAPSLCLLSAQLVSLTGRYLDEKRLHPSAVSRRYFELINSFGILFASRLAWIHLTGLL